jgi:hypothetical protein
MPPRKRKRKSLKELGYKAKAALEKLAEKAKPAPLPVPARVMNPAHKVRL